MFSIAALSGTPVYFAGSRDQSMQTVCKPVFPFLTACRFTFQTYKPFLTEPYCLVCSITLRALGSLTRFSFLTSPRLAHCIQQPCLNNIQRPL